MRSLFLSALLAIFAAWPGAAQQQKAPTTGLLLMAHGGTPEWNAEVERAVAPLRDRYPVVVAYGMADPASLGEGLDALARKGVDRVAVVRLFIDGRSFLHQTAYFLGLRPDPPAQFVLHDHGRGHGQPAEHGGHGAPHGAAHAAPRHHGGSPGGGHEAPAEADVPAPVAHTLQVALSDDGLMQADEIGAILAARAEAISRTPAQESVLVLAHGTGDDVENARWISAIEHLGGPLRAFGFHAVRVETLREDWPEARVPAERAIRSFVEAETEAGRRVLVVPFRLAGFGPYREVLGGLTYEASEVGILPHDAVTAWIERAFHEVAAREGWGLPTP